MDRLENMAMTVIFGVIQNYTFSCTINVAQKYHSLHISINGVQVWYSIKGLIFNVKAIWTSLSF